MKCPHCGQPMGIESRHENIIVFRCRDENCKGYLDKIYQDTGERPPQYDNMEQYYKETLINEANQKEEGVS